MSYLIEMKILYTELTKEYLNELIEILYNKHYFSFRRYAKKYVESVVKEMEATIHIKQKYEASSHFSRYGQDLYYVAYPKNKRTTWYFFFTYHPMEDIYFIRYISNNHVAGHLI